MSDAAKNVVDQVDVQRGAILELLQSMIRLQPEGEAAVQGLVAQALARHGAGVENVRFEPRDVPLKDEFASERTSSNGQRESVVGSFSGSSGGRSLLLFAHPDGEPIGDTRDWLHNPFEGVIDNGRLYGWGVADDLLGVATAICAMHAIVASGVVLRGNVIIASTPSKRHARGVAAVLHHGYRADGAIYVHPAESGVGMKDIKAFTSGQLGFSVEVKGRAPKTTEPGHTGVAHLAISPLEKALILIGALRNLDHERGERVHHPTIDEAVGRSTNILISSLQFGSPGEKFSRMPELCLFGGAVTFPPNEKMVDVQAEFQAALNAASEKDPWLSTNRPTLHWLSGASGMEVPVDHPLYRIVSSAITDIAAIEPHVNPLHDSSDIRNPVVQQGIPTIGFGPICGDLTQTGHHDEWVDVEDYVRAVKVTAQIIVEWCGAE